MTDREITEFERRYPPRSIDLPYTGRRRTQILEELWNAAQAGLVSDLRLNGIDIDTLEDLQQNDGLRAAAIPFLIEWLPRIVYASQVWFVIGLLEVKEHRRKVFPVLLAIYREPPYSMNPFNDVATRQDWDDGIREQVANVLGRLADRTVWREYLDLVADGRYGGTRSVLIDYIHRIKDPRVPEILMSLLDDRTVVQFAIRALGRLRYHPARARLEQLAEDPDDEVRRQVRYALKRLDDA